MDSCYITYMSHALFDVSTFKCRPHRILVYVHTYVYAYMYKLWCLFGGKRGDCQNCSVLYCVLKLRTVINTLRWAVLTVLWIGFCLTAGPISLCVDLFVFVCICVFCFLLHSCCIIVSAVGWTWWDWSLIFGPIFLQCFDTVGWVIWPIKTCPRYDL